VEGALLLVCPNDATKLIETCRPSSADAEWFEQASRTLIAGDAKFLGVPMQLSHQTKVVDKPK
jgi:hypothetical protein